MLVYFISKTYDEFQKYILKFIIEIMKIYMLIITRPLNNTDLFRDTQHVCYGKLVVW